MKAADEDVVKAKASKKPRDPGLLLINNPINKIKHAPWEGSAELLTAKSAIGGCLLAFVTCLVFGCGVVDSVRNGIVVFAVLLTQPDSVDGRIPPLSAWQFVSSLLVGLTLVSAIATLQRVVRAYVG